MHNFSHTICSTDNMCLVKKSELLLLLAVSFLGKCSFFPEYVKSTFFSLSKYILKNVIVNVSKCVLMYIQTNVPNALAV